jgi:outer membrane protein TolC
VKQRSKYLVFTLMIWLLSAAILPISTHQTQKTTLSLLEAIHICLKENFDIKRSNIQVKSAESNWQELKGDFDFFMNIYAATSHQELDPVNPESNVSELGLGINKLLANGMKGSAAIKNQRIKTPSGDGEALNYASLDFKIEIPLLKNSGKKSVYAHVTAAHRGVETQKLYLRHQIRQSIREMIITYWQYLAETMILEERKKAEQRAQKLLSDCEELVKRQEVAPAEIIQYQGNLGGKISARIAQEQTLYEAKIRLGTLMGLSSSEINLLPPPGEQFPKIDSGQSELTPDQLMQIMKNIPGKRFDYLAMKNEEKTARIMIQAFKINRKPDLRLNVGLGYTGYRMGDSMKFFWQALNRNFSGMNFNLGVVYSWPLGNNTSKGIYNQRLMDFRTFQENLKEMQLNIELTFFKYYNYLIGLLKQLKYTQLSTENFGKALENEQIKYKMNMSTQINIIETEENFMEAAIREIVIRKELAITIINLRFTMGELGYFKNDKFVTEKSNLIHLPTLTVKFKK